MIRRCAGFQANFRSNQRKTSIKGIHSTNTRLPWPPKDVGRYPGTRIGEIHQRVGLEIPRSRVRRAVEQLVKDGKLSQEGVRSGTRYRLR